MINPNYNYVDPIANQFVDNVAKGMPHPVIIEILLEKSEIIII